MSALENLDKECLSYNDDLQGIQLELELFKRTTLLNKSVIIVEKNKTICLQLSSILKKIGFNIIKFCENTGQGFHVFNQIHDNYDEAIIFLSILSNDSSAVKIILDVLALNPHTKIILLASPGENLQTNMVLMQGVFDTLEIPLSMPKVNSIIEKIKQEYPAEKHSQTQSMIQAIISPRKHVSVLELSELVGTKPETIKGFLEFLESTEKAKNIGKTKILSCHECASVLITSSLLCPNCNLQTFHQKDLIEHYPCGNLSVASEYGDGMCPNCRKELIALGVDYRKISEHFVCDDCNEKFTEPKLLYSCKKCNADFSLKNSKIVETEKFLLIN